MEEDPDNDNVESGDTDDITFESMDRLLTVDTEEDELTQVQYDLPSHERCAAHTLNLVASTGVDKHLSSSPNSRNIYKSLLAKCSALWNKVNQLTVASDNSQEIVKRKLLVPDKTRWNSQYDAIVRIAENTMSELNELCMKIGVRSFVEREITFW